MVLPCWRAHHRCRTPCDGWGLHASLLAEPSHPLASQRPDPFKALDPPSPSRAALAAPEGSALLAGGGGGGGAAEHLLALATNRSVVLVDVRRQLGTLASWDLATGGGPTASASAIQTCWAAPLHTEAPPATSAGLSPGGRC